VRENTEAGNIGENPTVGIFYADRASSAINSSSPASFNFEDQVARSKIKLQVLARDLAICIFGYKSCPLEQRWQTLQELRKKLVPL
jgi:hypothetical protein